MKIEIKNVSMSYKDGKALREVLNNFSLQIETGEFVMILGPSGCGKSTLLNILGGILRPNAGKVLMNGTDYYSLSNREQDSFRRENIGYVFQKFYLVEDISPLDDVMLMMPKEMSMREKKKRAIDIVSSLGIEDKIYSKINTFSGGEQQRLAIARAIAQKGGLLLCDEPTGNLDEDNTRQIMDILKRLQKEGKTIIMVTHNNALCKYASRIIQMSGCIVSREDKV